MAGLSVKHPLGGAPAHSLDVHVGPPGLRSLPVRCASPSGLRLLPELARGHGHPRARRGFSLEAGSGSDRTGSTFDVAPHRPTPLPAGDRTPGLSVKRAPAPAGDRMSPMSTSRTSQTLALWRSAPGKPGRTPGLSVKPALSVKSAGREYPCPLAGRSRRPSWPPFTARPLRFAILASLASGARSWARASPPS